MKEEEDEVKMREDRGKTHDDKKVDENIHVQMLNDHI